MFLIVGDVYGQWIPVPTNLASIYLNSVDSESVIVKVNENDFYRMIKNTADWKPINTGYTKSGSYISNFSHYKSTLIFAEGGQDGKVFLSSNNGVSFDSLRNYGSITFPRVFMNSSTGRIYLNAITGIKLQYTDDLGKSWTIDTLGIDFLQYHQPESIFTIDSFECQKANTGFYIRSGTKNEPWKLWVKAYDINKSSQLYSIIKHQNYFLAATSSGIYKYNVTDSSWVKFDQNNHIQIIANMISLGRFVAFSNSSAGVYISGNEGLSWTHLPLDTAVNKSFRINKFDNKLLLFTNMGVYSLDTNTFTWSRFGNKLMGLNVVDMVKVNNQVLASSYAFGITETNLQGEYQNTLPKHNANALYHNANKLYVATNLGIKQKDIGSNNWQNIHPLIDNQNFLQILLDKDSLYCLSKTDFWVKPLNDTTCIRIGSGLNVTTTVSLVQTSGNFYAITNGTFTYAVYKFNPINTTWEAIENTLAAASLNAVCHYKGNVLFATNMGLHQYNPIEHKWTEITSSQKLGNIKAIQSNESALILYSENMPGVYFCNDTSYNFHPISGDLPSMNITKFYFQQDTLFLGGSKGIWFRPLSQLASSINRFEPNINEISVYPNPFYETLNIEWKSKNLEAADLQIIDMQGRIIWHKTALQLPNAINLPFLQPGLYFLKLSQDSTSITKRILKL